MNKSKKTMQKMLNLVQEYDKSFLDDPELDKRRLASTQHASLVNSTTDIYTRSVDLNNKTEKFIPFLNERGPLGRMLNPKSEAFFTQQQEQQSIMRSARQSIDSQNRSQALTLTDKYQQLQSGSNMSMDQSQQKNFKKFMFNLGAQSKLKNTWQKSNSGFANIQRQYRFNLKVNSKLNNLSRMINMPIQKQFRKSQNEWQAIFQRTHRKELWHDNFPQLSSWNYTPKISSVKPDPKSSKFKRQVKKQIKRRNYSYDLSPQKAYDSVYKPYVKIVPQMKRMTGRNFFPKKKDDIETFLKLLDKWRAQEEKGKSRKKNKYSNEKTFKRKTRTQQIMTYQLPIIRDTHKLMQPKYMYKRQRKLINKYHISDNLRLAM